jgi:hypothetical protein
VAMSATAPVWDDGKKGRNRGPPVHLSEGGWASQDRAGGRLEQAGRPAGQPARETKRRRTSPPGGGMGIPGLLRVPHGKARRPSDSHR